MDEDSFQARRASYLMRAKASMNAMRKRKRPPRKGGGSEAVTVEPNRPKLGEGGAAAPLEFDER